MNSLINLPYPAILKEFLKSSLHDSFGVMKSDGDSVFQFIEVDNWAHEALENAPPKHEIAAKERTIECVI